MFQMKINPIHLVVVFCLINCSILQGQCNRVSDSLALVKIFNECVGTGWTNKNNWLVPGQNISTWYGVKLNASGCVESLILPSNKMNGALPPETGDLKALKILTLTNNNISGNLPSSIGNLTALEELNLSSNQFNGPVHAQMGNLTNLKKMVLSLNNFSGNLPNTLGNLKELVILHLHQNNFNGFIPSGIGNLSKLEELLLSQNDFIGTIPSTLGNLQNLKSLILSQNQLTGIIPAELGNATGLYFFYADENQLTGKIPTEIGNLNKLRELWLNKNQLSGEIPTEISSFSKLQKLLLNDNKLTGQIPPLLGNLTDLVSLHISNNLLSGSIPESVGNLTKLISFLANDNALTGSIPASIGKMVSLNSLTIHNNQLSGEIPASLGLLNNLKRIYVQNNQLEGCFPKSMQKFCSLSESNNVNTSGYNFRQNTNLIFGGDFKRWCSGEGRAKATISANSPLCEGSILNMAGSGGNSFMWSGPVGFSSTEQTIQISSIKAEEFGQYTLIVVNENKCTDTTNILIKSIGNVTVSSNSPVCEGVDIELQANGGLTYTWTGPNGFQSTLPNPVLMNSNPSMQGEYVVEIKTNDCTIIKKVPVEFTKTANIISNSPVCEGDSIKLSISDGVSFLWSGPKGFSSENKSAIIPISDITQSGTYLAVVKNSDNCQFTLTTDVEIMGKKVPELTDFVGMCDNSTELVLPSNVDGYSGLWSGDGVVTKAGNQEFIPYGLKGIQKLQFTPDDDGRCVASIEKEIFVSYLKIKGEENLPSLNSENNNGSAIINVIHNTSSLTIDYSGLSSGVLSSGPESIIHVSNLTSGVYFFTVRDNNGCTDTTTVQIRYLKPFYFLPNVVSSKVADENSTFYLKGSNIYSYHMTIYDRWGNVVFTKSKLAINDNNGGWVPEKNDSGVFIYVLTIETFEGIKVLSGSVTVL